MGSLCSEKISFDIFKALKTKWFHYHEMLYRPRFLLKRTMFNFQNKICIQEIKSPLIYRSLFSRCS